MNNPPLPGLPIPWDLSTWKVASVFYRKQRVWKCESYKLHSFVFPKLDKQITKSCKLLFSHSRALPLSQQTYIYGFENIFVPHQKMSLENMPTVAPKTQLGLKIIPMATRPSFTLKYDLMNLVVATVVQNFKFIRIYNLERTEKDWITLQRILFALLTVCF